MTNYVNPFCFANITDMAQMNLSRRMTNYRCALSTHPSSETSTATRTATPRRVLIPLHAPINGRLSAVPKLLHHLPQSTPSAVRRRKRFLSHPAPTMKYPTANRTPLTTPLAAIRRPHWRQQIQISSITEVTTQLQTTSTVRRSNRIGSCIRPLDNHHVRQLNLHYLRRCPNCRRWRPPTHL